MRFTVRKYVLIAGIPGHEIVSEHGTSEEAHRDALSRSQIPPTDASYCVFEGRIRDETASYEGGPLMPRHSLGYYDFR